MGISLDMLKGPRGIDFVVHLTTLGLWNQEMQNFLRMTLLVGVISFRTLFFRRIIMKINLPIQVIDLLSFTPLKYNRV